jgi:hypothetical protein
MKAALLRAVGTSAGPIIAQSLQSSPTKTPHEPEK